MSPSTSPLSSSARQQLAPEGRIKVGIAVGPAVSPVWTTRDATTGRPRGVTVDIAHLMGERFGLPVELVEHASSGDIIARADDGLWTVAFAPVDAERKLRVDFGTNYALGVSTYLVRGDSDLVTVDDVDAPGIRVLGIEGTATLRSSRRTLRATEPKSVVGLDEAVALFRAGEVDAIALGRESILSLVPQLPGSRVADGHFHEAGMAVAVPHGNPDALEALTALIEDIKASGVMRQIFDRNGQADAVIAPAGSRP